MPCMKTRPNRFLSAANHRPVKKPKALANLREFTWQLDFPTTPIAVSVDGITDQVHFAGRIEAEVKVSCPVSLAGEPCRIRVPTEPEGAVGVGENTQIRFRIRDEARTQFTGNPSSSFNCNGAHRICVSHNFWPTDPCHPVTVVYRLTLDNAGRATGLTACDPGRSGLAVYYLARSGFDACSRFNQSTASVHSTSISPRSSSLAGSVIFVNNTSLC